jgi:hypothetical protein
MRRVKGWQAFLESSGKEVPEGFVFLGSIGYYMDPVYGGFYDVDAEGGLIDYALSLDNLIDDEVLENDLGNLSEADRQALESAWRGAEDEVKPIMDWDLIDDIKQLAISEEILDKGMFVRIRAKIISEKFDEGIWKKAFGVGDQTVYFEMFDNGDGPYYPKMFRGGRELLKGIDSSCISYGIGVMKPDGGGFLPAEMAEAEQSFIARVKGMYPDAAIEYEKW